MIITIANLRAAGLTEAQIMRVVEIADTEYVIKTREKNRIASRNYRARHQRHHDGNDADDGGYPPSLLTSSVATLEKEERSEIVAQGEFVTFWQQYPNKVGKRAAEKSYRAARRRATAEVIMAGLARYAGKRDDRPWCNPATWLNQDRWGDQPGPSQDGNKGANGTGEYTAADRWRDLAACTLREREQIEREGRR